MIRPTEPGVAVVPAAGCRSTVDDSRMFRTVMGHFATGVAVVSVRTPRAAHACTVNSVTSVSLEPRLLLVCLARDGTTARLLRECRGFALTILAAAQRRVAERLALRDPVPGDGRLAGLAHRDGPWTGAALLDGAIAWIECAVHQIVPGGDHDIVIGRVLGLAVGEGDATPLTFYRGQLGHLATAI